MYLNTITILVTQVLRYKYNLSSRGNFFSIDDCNYIFDLVCNCTCHCQVQKCKYKYNIMYLNICSPASVKEWETCWKKLRDKKQRSQGHLRSTNLGINEIKVMEKQCLHMSLSVV